MHLKNLHRIIITILFVLAQINTFILAQDLSPLDKPYLFQGEVGADNINIRSDSSINSEVICRVNKGEAMDVAAELYDWYKIRLPVSAPSYIKKDLVLLNSDNTAIVLKNNVNIRLHPDTSARILGRANKNDLVKVLEERADWYRIEPVKESFGWIHKNFVKKIEEKKIELVQKDDNKVVGAEEKKEEAAGSKKITLEGIIRPKVFKRVATHKLIAKDHKLYLLKGDKEYLNSFNHQSVRLTGKITDINTGQKPVLLEVEKIEVIN